MRAESKSYTGIDCFRMIAAVLIIAIHTSPLGTYSELGDFILTRVIARVAVPFFFMTSGFFLISRYSYKSDKFMTFLKKTALIYGAAILLYIPINIYNGYFKMENLLPNLIKDIVFDGTLYHLWYLPASLAGGALAWGLVRKSGFHRAFAVTAVLYLIGLFGDSYYGMAENVPVLGGFYTLWFQVSDYTRNGIFFAPVFFVLGGWIADAQTRIRPAVSWTMCIVMLLFMLAEGLLLHHFQVQRHDSMYLFLLPCMYFLFQALLSFRGKRHVWLRDVSLLVYSIHPMMIVVIRLAAKVLHLQTLLVENSIVHFLAVTVTSVSFSVAAAAFWQRFGRRKKEWNQGADRAYIEINLDNLTHNVQVLRGAMPAKCELMAVVKAQAYGHGMYEIATHLDRIGVRAFAAATIDEGIALRRFGVRGEILVLGCTLPERASELHRYGLSQTLSDYDYACRLNAQGVPVKAHIKLDTGMHRLGERWDNLDEIVNIFQTPNLHVAGIYSHLCVSDMAGEKAQEYTLEQIHHFEYVAEELHRRGFHGFKCHLQGSYGVLNYSEYCFDYARVGIALYGLYSQKGDQGYAAVDLKPVLSLKARVTTVKTLSKGEGAGYGLTYNAKMDRKIAVLSIGYADGVPRNLSNCGYVLCNGKLAPIVGRICMDQMMVDVTEIPQISPGEEAVLIGKSGSLEIRAEDLAQWAGTISNEIVSRLGERLERVAE